ncbi:restriction endonuclease subunit S [Acinetobacter rudis]|uniref:Restriction endonuclease subunit S n=1 Tax=Acinetobacter rudis TaxID=632955 RepID=A0AAW8J7C8_9GAMM|nr:restriction endonuclease subunit S [Acinetobacter rudis]MDQ8935069.1 restriction endonuclease subunit S [Acinetobacter rudis]MDQ9017376.1 restriction endonuclease subunit S [Acinetobacter rudis]
MSKYKKYPEYKDSGVEWLGEIPSHWDLKSSKFLFNIVNGSTPKSGIEDYWEGDITWVTPSDLSKIQHFEISESSRNITQKGLDSCGTSLVPKRSLILSCRAPIGSLAITTKEVCTNQGCKSLVVKKEINTKFMYYFLSVSTEQLNVLGRGTTFLELSSDELGNFKLPYPISKEQFQIANFLDHETAKIDSLIAKQEKLIELLKEKRQAVISHAVTKGLNPDVAMKDSGVEWLGEVPEHWGISKVGFHTLKIGSGKTPKGGAEIYQENGILFIRSQNVYNDGLRVSNSECVYISKAIHDEMSASKVLSGDILLNITGGSIGRSCLVSNNFPEANVNQHVCIIRVDMHLQNFLSLVIQSDLIQAQIRSIQTGGNREGLNFEQVSKFSFSLPPRTEQEEVVQYVKNKSIEFQKVEERARNAIQLMQERRTALISAAVTGKIDVRHWQAPKQQRECATELIA